MFGNWPVTDGTEPVAPSRRDDRHILFVCTGNIARSAGAELLAKQRYGDLDLDYSSAGTGVFSRTGVASDVAPSLDRRGVDGSHHVSRQFDDQIARHSGLILVMEAGHRTWILDEWPELVGRVALLREAASIAAATSAPAESGPFSTRSDAETPHGKHGRLDAGGGSIAEQIVRACTHGSEFDLKDPYRQGREAGETAIAQVEEALDVLLPWYARTTVR